ncbi:MAG: hypothetical protein Q8K68_07865, partial [Nitrospirota bacterium]|nr:hypothetical protein [Nitrospirota bacterium]
DDQAVNDFLLQERIRTTAYISTPLAQKLGEQLKLDAVLLGAVFVYDDSENPKFGLSARLLSTRRSDLIWTGYASDTGEDFTKILGLGTITSIATLVDTVVGRLFAGISTAEGLGRETETAYRVAVMPFLNKTRKPDAGMVATNLFLARLFQSPKFLPIEYGDVRNTVVTKKIRSKGELSHGSIDAFAEAIHADAVLVGVVEHFDDGSATGAPPAVIITARLIDSRTRRILWYDDMQLNGDERIRFFDIGKLRTVDKVAFSAVGDMIKRMERLEWK